MGFALTLLIFIYSITNGKLIARNDKTVFTVFTNLCKKTCFRVFWQKNMTEMFLYFPFSNDLPKLGIHAWHVGFYRADTRTMNAMVFTYFLLF